MLSNSIEPDRGTDTGELAGNSASSSHFFPLTIRAVRPETRDAMTVPVVTGHADMTVIDKIITLAQAADPVALSAGAWQAHQFAIAHLAIEFVSGPGGLASVAIAVAPRRTGCVDAWSSRPHICAGRPAATSPHGMHMTTVSHRPPAGLPSTRWTRRRSRRASSRTPPSRARSRASATASPTTSPRRNSTKSTPRRTSRGLASRSIPSATAC